MKNKKVIIIDLDGTLIDSSEGIFASARYALEKTKLPPMADVQLRAFIGPPLVQSFMKYCGLDEQDALEAVAIYREHYAEKGVKMYKPYDGIVDLLTILPFYFLDGFIVFRMLRVVRIFHLFRINTQYESFQVITSVLKEKRNAILYSVFIIVVLILASSLTMYSVEHAAQPETFKNAFSGIWWSVSTVFTVGYGDIYPVTVLGRVMGVIITFLGVGAVAIPTGILSAGFVEHYSRMQRSVEAAEYKNSSAVILADKASPYAGRRVKEIEEMNAVCVTALIRGELVIVPEDTVRIEEGDVLLVTKL